MRSTWFVLPIILFSMVSSAQADSPQLYVGGGVSVSLSVEDNHKQYHVTDFCGYPYLGNGYIGPAGLFEYGYRGSFYDLHGAVIGQSGFATTERWYSLRLGIGSRLRVSDHFGNPIKPFIGAGVQAGWARYSTNHAFSRSSKLSPGVFGEVGITVATRSAIRPAIMLRYDRLWSRIDLSTTYIPGSHYVGIFLMISGLIN